MISDITPPNTEPITLATAKLFLRIDHDEEDSLIADFIQSARLQIEKLCRKALISRPQRLTLTPPFESSLSLNIEPVEAVNAVFLHFADGTIQSLSLDNLSINLKGSPASLSLKGVGVPAWHSRSDIYAVSIEVMAGYGEGIDDIPMPLRQAMLLLVGQAYEHRVGQNLPSIPMMVDALIMPYRSLKL